MPPRLKSRPSLFAVSASGLALAALVAVLFINSRPEAREGATPPSPEGRADEIPRTVLWAWERPEDLSFIDPRRTGVAFLARTVQLRGGEASVRPRLQPLEVPPGTYLVAVVRVESDRRERPSLSPAQLERTVAAAAEAARGRNVRALQIDFDAGVSERDFYRRLLASLRARLPDGMPLSMTALASWCMRDGWLEGLDVDEAVPMLFRMGVDEHRIKDFLAAGGELDEALCQSSAGISTDEQARAPRSAARLYVFNPRGWTHESARAFTAEADR